MAQHLRTTLRIAHGGRIAIPAEVRDRLGMEVGADIILTVKGDHATLINAKSARRSAQAMVKKLVPRGVSMSEELMKERKAEARRE